MSKITRGSGTHLKHLHCGDGRKRITRLRPLAQHNNNQQGKKENKTETSWSEKHIKRKDVQLLNRIKCTCIGKYNTMMKNKATVLQQPGAFISNEHGNIEFEKCPWIDMKVEYRTMVPDDRGR